MRILISGATGLVGSALVETLHGQGYNIRCLQRHKEPGSESMWNAEELFSPEGSTEPFKVVIHLASENVAAERWSSSRKRRILNSRVDGTRELVSYLSTIRQPPSIFLCASAVWYYGDRGDEWLTETSHPGNGFLAEVCRKWEAEAAKAAQFSERVVNLRFGMILSPKGGPLHKMLPSFKSGLGGPIGKGKQYMSWVSIRDVVKIIQHIILTDSLEGPINVVSPEPVQNKIFAETLGTVLNKPARVSAPPFALRLLFGDMADEMLLCSNRAKPEKLLASGYSFQDTDLRKTLTYCVQ